MIGRANKNWNNEISDSDILCREFTIGYLLQTNEHIPFLNELKSVVFSTYKVVAEFEYMGYNGKNIYANNQKLLYRNRKTSDFSVGKDVKVISHEFSHKGCGSNKYPSVTSKEGSKCILEFISYGLPFIDKTNGWRMKIITIETI